MNESSLSSDHNTNRNISSISDIDHLVSQIDTTCNIEDTTVVESKFAACLVCCQIVSKIFYYEFHNSSPQSLHRIIRVLQPDHVFNAQLLCHS